ncbi:MAG: asparagine synthase (glutamine-hydrolyzing) [Pseudonocardiaceae bacterium]
MCGIAGFLDSKRLVPDADRQIGMMLATLAHRGPDSHGQCVDRESSAVLGHVRLAINDLSPTGNQPLVSPNGRHVLVVAGEVYGFRQARTLLTAQGEKFTSKSDSELILALYRRHGLDFVDHLRGEFAISLFDRESNRLILARDRFGVRPLYYYADQRLVVWASEVKALLSHPAVPRQLCRRAAVHQLLQVMVPGTSAFERILAVPPGCLVVVDRDRHGLTLSRRTYWDLDFAHADNAGHADPAEHVEAVREAVVDALAVRTEADVPVGVYLSGGMDSGALLSLANSVMQTSPRAFTLAFEDPAYDESPIARQVAAELGIDLSTRSITDDDLYGENYVRAVWHSERTFYNTLGIAKMHLSAFARSHGIRAVISGEGADELFAGYPAFAIDHAAESGTPAAAREADALFVGAIVPATPRRHPAFERICGFTPAWVQPWISTWERVRPLLDDGLTNELGDYDPLESVAESLDVSRIQGRRRLDIAQYSWIKTMLDGQILSWGGDRVDMANAVESRPGFLDHRVAEVAATVPPDYRIRNGREKWVLREAMRHVLPDVLYQRRKFAFMAPPAHRSPARADRLTQLAEQYLSPQRIDEVGICDPGRTRDFLDSALSVRDTATANEIDKVYNHLLGLHIVHDLFVR